MAATTATATNGDASAQGSSKVQASEVGWQFVPQYYTFVNTSPQRLHCFYNKKSTFIHGVEGEDVKPCYGQQEIHQKIMSFGFQDCKVYIHSIDSQSSADGGVIIQVIGEMSNAGGSWRKFTQTFFLAEQPNGYFVLNDIFRYLKEEDEDEDVEEEEDEAVEPVQQGLESAAETQAQDPAPSSVPAAIAPADAPVVSAASAPEETVTASRDPVPVPAASEKVEEPAPPKEEPAPAVEQPKAEAATTSEEPAAEAPKPAEKVAEKAATAPAPAPTPAPAPASKPAQPQAQASAPAQKSKPAAAAPAQPPAPAKPAGPKTWASLAASKSNSWGTALANKEASSTTVAPASTPAPAPAQQQRAQAPTPQQAAQQQDAPAQQQQGQQGQRPQQGGRPNLLEAAQNVQTPVCFVKLGNWQNPEGSDSVDPAMLRAALSRFGEITDVQIVKGKACAFVDFKQVDSARKAIIASLHQKDGGEGGVRLADGARITVEPRKEKEERGKTGGGAGAKRVGGGGAPATGGQQGEGERGGFSQRGGRGGKSGRGRPQSNVAGDRNNTPQQK